MNFRDNLPEGGGLFRMIEEDRFDTFRERQLKGPVKKKKKKKEPPAMSERQQEFLQQTLNRDREVYRRKKIITGKKKALGFNVMRVAMKFSGLTKRKFGKAKMSKFVIDPDIFQPTKDDAENNTEIVFFDDLQRLEELRQQREKEERMALLELQEQNDDAFADDSVSHADSTAAKKKKKRKHLSAKKAQTAKENELLERRDYLLRWLEKHHGNLREAKEESIQKRQIYLNYHWIARLAINFYNLSAFQIFVMLVITFNVVILSLDMWPTPDRATSILLDEMNFVCTVIFLVEFVAAHAGLGLIAYWTNGALIFDGLIVLASVAELAAAAAGGSPLTSLRGLRLLRVFRMARKWKSLALLMGSMYRSFLQLGNFTILLCLMIAVFALMGQTFFAAVLIFDPDTGHWIEECAGIGDREGSDQRCDLSL
eukprot:g17214.t1